MKVQKAHKRIYKALVEGNDKKARAEMMSHIREVERDLPAIERERTSHALA